MAKRQGMVRQGILVTWPLYILPSPSSNNHISILSAHFLLKGPGSMGQAQSVLRCILLPPAWQARALHHSPPHHAPSPFPFFALVSLCLPLWPFLPALLMAMAPLSHTSSSPHSVKTKRKRQRLSLYRHLGRRAGT